MRTLLYTGPVDTLEIHDPEKPEKVLFSEHLVPGKTYKLPEAKIPVIEQMITRELFVKPQAETEASPVIATSPAEPAPVTVPATLADAAGKGKRG